MSIEAAARAWAHQHGLQRSRVVTGAYRWLSLIRYRNRWDVDVQFRGGQFSIGRDLSLYPAVRNGGFESVELDSFIPRVPVDSVVWDVGANIGIYAVLLGKAASSGRVISFEPVPETRARLERNLATNRMRNVAVHAVALSSRPGTATMEIHPEAHGCDQIVNNPEGPVVEVQTMTGDDFAAEHGDPDVIKVDIEGHEPEFFEGCSKMLERRKPLLMLEVNPTTWGTPERYQTWHDALARLFELYGSGDWVDAAGSTRVSSVDVHALSEHAAYTLILPSAGA
jgi:FkbM family methyltransferase